MSRITMSLENDFEGRVLASFDLDEFANKVRADAINEMKDKLQLSAIYTETENGWSGMTVDTIQIEEIANELKEQKNG